MDCSSDKYVNTRSSRTSIGFLSNYKMWKDEPALFTKDTLTIHGHPVMERWEDNYMRVLAQIACQRGGVVLEIGFGMGISASYIQQETVSKHIIIEANTDVFKKLIDFSKNAQKEVFPIFGFWQDVIHRIPDESLSGILFDTYPLSEKEIHKNHFSFFQEAYRLLQPGGVFTYYSDEIDGYSAEHIQHLRDKGFLHIDGIVCEVEPPTDCKYWENKTILAPIVIK